MLAQSPMDMRRLYLHHGVEQDLESCSVLLADFRTFSGMGDPVPGQCLVVLGDGEWLFQLVGPWRFSQPLCLYWLPQWPSE